MFTKNLLIIFVVSFSIAFYCSSVNAQTVEKKGETKPLKIKSKPSPSAKECSEMNGMARLRVTFDKSAKVTEIQTVVLSGCDYFDKQASNAAKRIKFEPAMENGEPITVTKLVEYQFTKY